MVATIPVNEHLEEPMEEPMEEPVEAAPPEEADERNQSEDPEEDHHLMEKTPAAEQVLENKAVTQVPGSQRSGRNDQGRDTSPHRRECWNRDKVAAKFKASVF